MNASNSNSDDKISTNLEKKTKYKIAKMTEDVNTMDFVLKNIKLLNRLKICRVRLAKVRNAKVLSKKKLNFGKIKPQKVKNLDRTLPTKIAASEKQKNTKEKDLTQKIVAVSKNDKKENNINNKRVSTVDEEATKKIKKEDTKEKSNSLKSVSNGKRMLNAMEEVIKNVKNDTPKEKAKSRKSENDSKRLSNVNEKSLENIKTDTPKQKVNSRKSDGNIKKVSNTNQEETKIVKKEEANSQKGEGPSAKKQKTPGSKENLEKNKRKEKKKGRQIYIHLPFLENAKIRSLNKELLEREATKKQKAKLRAKTLKRLGRKYLTEKFGTRYFRCHVKVARYRDPNYTERRKHNKVNRKSVSFVETVEIFGESDDESLSILDMSRTSIPAQDKDTSIVSIESNDSEGSVSGSPRKRKISSLKSSDVPRSARIRKSDEKIPRLQANKKKKASGKIKSSKDSDVVLDSVPDVTTVPEEEIQSNAKDDEPMIELHEKDKEVCDQTENREESEKEESENESEKEENNEDEKAKSGEESESVKSGEEPEKVGSEEEPQKENSREESEKENSRGESEKENNKEDAEKENCEEESKKNNSGDESEEEYFGEEDEIEEVRSSSQTNKKSLGEDIDKNKSPVLIELDEDNDKSKSPVLIELDEDIDKSKSPVLIELDEEDEEVEFISDENQTSKNDDSVEKCPENSSPTNKTKLVSTSEKEASDKDKNPLNNETNNITTDDDIFLEAETTYDKMADNLQLSNNTDDISLTTEEPERRNSKSESVSNNTDPGTQPTKFSLNTFFKSLKTKISSDSSEKSPQSNGKQHTERDEDKSVRDELIIK